MMYVFDEGLNHRKCIRQSEEPDKGSADGFTPVDHQSKVQS